MSSPQPPAKGREVSASPLSGAACARHPAAPAVEVCTRCGAFACAACTDYVDAFTPVCAPCAALLARGRPSWRSRLGVWACALGLLGMLVGLWAPGRLGLLCWLAFGPTGLVGLGLSLFELRRLRRAEAPPGLARLPRLGRALGVAHLALVVLLGLAFVGFLVVRGGP
jgi:hypothetical protein